MNTSLVKYFFSFIVIALLASCKQMKVVSTTDNDIINSQNKAFKQIESQQKLADFESIVIQGNLSQSIKSEIPELKITMVVEKDKLIWTNASFLIFSARSLVTPNKFKAYEKIKRTYVDEDFSYINNLLGLDFIDFESVQKLLTGKLFFPISTEEFNFDISKNQYLLISKEPILVKMKDKQKKYNRKIIFNSDFSINSIAFNIAFWSVLVAVLYFLTMLL